MKRSAFLMAALAGSLLLCGFLVEAQEDQRPARTMQTEFEQQVAVNYMLVDIIVTDRAGNYVRNLAIGDFELYENGRLVEIQSLDEYQMTESQTIEVEELSEGTLEPQQPPRNIVILFDLLYSSSYGIQRAIEVAEEFVIDRIQPGDRVMVISYYNSMRTVQPFTADKNQVVRAMREMGFSTDRGAAPLEAPVGAEPATDPGMGDAALDEQMGESRLQAQSDHAFAVQNARNYLISLEALASVLKYYPGRKTLILLSEGLNYDLIDPRDVNDANFGPQARQMVSEADATPGQRPQVSLFTDYDEMVEMMNDAKVSLYTVNVGGLRALGDAADQFATRNPIDQTQDVTGQMGTLRKRQEFLSGVSVDTGGRAYFNTNNILQLLTEIEIDISNYYILGYRTEFDPNRSRYRRIRVRASNPEYRVLHRRGFRTPRPFGSLSADERDLQLTEGFLTHTEINELGARLGFQFIRQTPDSLSVSACIEAPTEQLQPERGRYNFEVLVSDLDSEARIHSSVHKSYSIGADAELERTGLRIVESVEATLGLNRIRVALRDNNTGRRSYFYYNFVLRESAADTLLLTQPLFFNSDDMSRTGDQFDVSVQRLESWNEPPQGGVDLLRHPSEGSFFPLVSPGYRPGDSVQFMVSLYNLQRELGDESELQFQFAVSPAPASEDEQRLYYQMDVFEDQTYRLRTSNGVAYVADFPMPDLPPGPYDLFVVVNDAATERGAASFSRLVIIE